MRQVGLQRLGQRGPRDRVAVIGASQARFEALERPSPGGAGLGCVVLEPMVEATIADGSGERRMLLEERLPVVAGEAFECHGGILLRPPWAVCAGEPSGASEWCAAPAPRRRPCPFRGLRPAG